LIHLNLEETVVLEREKSAMEKRGLDVLIAMSPESVAYGIGCVIPSHFFARRRHAISVVYLDDAPTLIVADMEEEHAKNYSSVKDVRSYREFLQDPIDLLVDVLKEKGFSHGQIGIELSYIPAIDFKKLRSKLPGLKLIECTELFNELYTVKSDKQLSILRAVAKAAEKAIQEGFERLEVGMTEHDLARTMVSTFYGEGGDGIRLLVVGSGERSSYPNVGPSERVIKNGDLIRVDFLGLKEYFMSDVCRTAIVGKPSDKQRQIWNKLVKTEEAILETIEPGVKAFAVYKAYLKIWKDSGFNPVRFIGHGLGLSTHERPLLSDSDELALQEGMLLCIEPLLLIPKLEGYHLEDEVLVTRDGYEIVTNIMDTSQLYEIK
ncbi:MAG: Xaa-Pro peptidase family protein, partial [Dehalococcoidia bacterium]|nr:Xaa-Pro peptidase family protein [Dehalococcoidia bacterium]